MVDDEQEYPEQELVRESLLLKYLLLHVLDMFTGILIETIWLWRIRHDNEEDDPWILTLVNF